MSAIKLISRKLKQTGADGINLLHASGKSAQQSCFHFHFYLIPRYKDDGLDTWPKTDYKESNFPQVYEDIRKLF
jgi:histidine triad (HIT) family protein